MFSLGITQEESAYDKTEIEKFRSKIKLKDGYYHILVGSYELVALQKIFEDWY